jgi:hypothetical protein
MSQRLQHEYQIKSCLISFLFLIGIFVCKILFATFFNKMPFLEAVATTFSTLGIFTVILVMLMLLIVFPIMLSALKRSNKRFLDSIGYKKRNRLF